jgi:hypothetical protein
LDEHEPGLTLNQGGDVAVLPARENIALPVARDRPVFHLGRTLSDGHGINNLPARLSAGRGTFASAHQPPSPQPRDQFLPQHPASLDEQAFIDRLVGHPHRLIIDVFNLEPAGYLLRRPIIVQLLCHHHLQGSIDVATDVTVYFCDPQSPWQRGSNENTNGLLRQYFPKGADLSGYSQDELDAVALQLNTRPRKTLGFVTPAVKLAATAASTA